MTDVYFWPHVRDLNVASFRLRCARVIKELNNNGWATGFYQKNCAPNKLVLSKRYDEESLKVALECKKRHGTKLYLDICDNHFYNKKNSDPFVRDRAEQLRKTIGAVDVVIASTAYLARKIIEEVPQVKDVKVVGDYLEQPNKNCFSLLKHPKDYLDYFTLARALDSLGKDKMTRLIWFGNHGSPHVDGGMDDIQRIRGVLEQINDSFPISLTVVSNSRSKYSAGFSDWSLPTFYRPWSRFNFWYIAQAHGVSILPIAPNEFTLAKTSNRVSTSLLHGLQVVSDVIPSYSEYEGNIYFSDWANNIRKAVSSSPLPSISVDEVKQKNSCVLSSWISILDLKRAGGQNGFL